MTKRVLETGLQVEMSEHLGYDKHAADGRNGGNARKGTRTKTVLTEVGPIDLDVPRDRDGTFEPQIFKKRQRRLMGLDEMVVSLGAKGLTTGEISAHLAEVYGAQVSKDTISKITDAVVGEMTEWLNRPLERVYAAVFIDAIVVKIRDGQVTNRPGYTAVGVTVDEPSRDVSRRLDDPEVVLEATYVVLGGRCTAGVRRHGPSGAPAGGQGVRLPAREERRA